MLAVHVFVCGSQCWQLCTCTNTLSPFVSPYVNVEVSGGDGAHVRKLAFSGGCASGLVKNCKVHTHWNCV